MQNLEYAWWGHGVEDDEEFFVHDGDFLFSGTTFDVRPPARLKGC